jgi:hypothetical protein
MQRYNAPKGHEQAAIIQARVATFIKLWIESAADEISTDIIKKAVKFANTQLTQHGHQSLAKQITNIAKKRVSNLLFLVFIIDL